MADAQQQSTSGLTFDAPVQQDTHTTALSQPSTNDGLTFDAPVQSDTPVPQGSNLSRAMGFDNGPGQFVKGAYESAVQPVVHAVTHPIDTVTQFIPNAIDSQKRMIANSDKVNADPNSTVGQRLDAALYELPLVGEQLKTMDDLNKNGEHARAYGQAAGLIASLLGPKAAEVASGPVLAKLATTTADVSPRVSRLVNGSIGLRSSDLSGWDKVHPGSAQEIGATVYKETGFQKSLTQQHAAIENAIKRNQDATADIVNKASASGATYDVHHTLLDQAVQLHDQLEQSGADSSKLRAVDANLSALEPTFAKSMTPTEMIEARNRIGKTITDWNPNTQDVGQRYRQMIYHDLNNRTQTLLPPAEADAFRANNRVINRLLIAKDAAGRKLVSDELKPASSTIASTLGRAVVGAVGGHVVGGVPGAVIGAALDAAAPHLAPTAVKVGDYVRQSAPNIISRAVRVAPAVAQAARATDLTTRQGDGTE